MHTYRDQMGHVVALPAPPHRIVSLVPSQTELLFDLGLDAEIVGVTKYCVHPAEKVAQKIRVGGTKKFKFDVIDALEPDLIIGNKEENYQEGIARLKEKYPVWMSDVVTLADAYEMIARVGAMVGRAAAARRLANEIQKRMARLSGLSPLRVAYFIWRRPYMVAGRDTFIHSLLEQAGFVNVFAHQKRYPEVGDADIRAAGPEFLLLSSEPFPFSEKYRPEFEEKFPQAHVVLVDGQMFSWYGSRLLQAPDYFESLRETLLPSHD